MVLELLDKVVVLAVSVFEIADNCIPDAKVVVEVTKVLFSFCQDFEGEIDTLFESIHHVMVIFVDVQEEVDILGEG